MFNPFQLEPWVELLDEEVGHEFTATGSEQKAATDKLVLQLRKAGKDGDEDAVNHIIRRMIRIAEVNASAMRKLEEEIRLRRADK